ncbi:MAG: CvpA family protein [Phototrophicaceae bacterium]
MIQLVGVMWVMAIFFAIIGFLRGWNKELVALSGIILGLFALFQFDPYIRGTLLVSVPRSQVFFIQTGLFITVVFFAYQTRGPLKSDNSGRDTLQESVLGSLLGFLNGYLIWGTIWYFLDINQYPLTPWVIAPSPGSPSDNALSILPLVILGGGPTGNGDLLAIAVIILFLIVLIVI